jgi:hypothetical protein
MFESYWKLAERCPSCGWQFERQVGFALGVMTVNLMATCVAFLAVVVTALALTWPDPPVALVTAIGVGTCIAVPVLFYPLAAGVWAAIDLRMRPLDPDEEAEAITWLSAQAVEGHGHRPRP